MAEKHRKMGNHKVGSYMYYEHGFTSKTINIIGCWDTETNIGEYDFYDIYEEGKCLNEGNPFFDYPDRGEVEDFIKDCL